MCNNIVLYECLQIGTETERDVVSGLQKNLEMNCKDITNFLTLQTMP